MGIRVNVQCNLDLVTLNLVTTCDLVTQYNKLAPNTLRFTYWNLKSCKPHEKMLDLLIKNWKLRVWCSLLHFFMWFATFQILICEPRIIWHKLLELSWLYKDWFHFTTLKTFNLVTLCNLITVFAESKSVLKSRLYCTYN